MARISFIPLPETGHVNPTFKLAKQLAQRGHQVSYLGLLDFEEPVRAQGMELLPIFTGSCPKGTLRSLAEQKLNYLEVLFRTRDHGRDREILAALGAAAPDLVLIDIVLQDLTLLAREAGVPCAVLSTSLHQPRLIFLETLQDPVHDHPLLVLCPRAFDFPHAAQRAGRHYLEPSIDLERRDSGGFPWEKLEDSRPLIYCSLGSHPHDYKQSEAFFRAVIGAAPQRPQWQLILAAGRAHIGDPVFQDLPPNVLAVDWVPQLEVLEKAHLMITHGGLGTVKECIYFGVPMVVFPMDFDQPENAERIAHHGLGLRGSTADVSARQVLLLVDKVLKDPAFKTRVAAMSATFREIEGSGIGVRIVEGLVDSLRNDGPRARSPFRRGGPIDGTDPIDEIPLAAAVGEGGTD